MKNTMKKLIACLAILMWLEGAAYPYSNSGAFTTGEDWELRMSSGEKFISLFAPTVLFRLYGVPIQRSPSQYIQAIDKILEFNPELLKEDISNIYASTVYFYEPQTRPAFDELEMRFLRGEFDLTFSPYLTYEDSDF